MTKTKYKFIHFEQCSNAEGNWDCLNNKTGGCLGGIGYYKAWRQFVFVPEGSLVVFSAGCLADIQHFMGQLDKPVGSK